MRTTDGWIKAYQDMEALWLHDGNPKRPHALLTSGKHSNGYFNSQLIILNEPLLRQTASDLVQQINGDINVINRVVGPQTGATKLAEFIAGEIGAQRNQPCTWASPAKANNAENKSMIFDDPTRTVLPGEVVLLCEDVLTTGDSVDLTATAATCAGGIILPCVVVLVNRSGLKEISGRKIIALIDRHMSTWTPEECPLCQAGSEAIRPKNPENWMRLNATY